MSETNKDGLPIGQPVDFQTVSRLERERFMASIKPAPVEAEQPRKQRKAPADSANLEK